MTKNQNSLLQALLEVRVAQEKILTLQESIEEIYGDESPIYAKLQVAIDYTDGVTDLLYRFFGNSHTISEEAKINFFRWINNDNYPTP